MQFLLETIRLGLANLRMQLLRSILTALGIIFGVAAVITMVGIGEGSTAEALARIERLGATNIILRSTKPAAEAAAQSGGGRGSFISQYGLQYADLYALQDAFGELARNIVPTKEVGSQIIRGDIFQTSQAFGVTPQMRDVARLTVARGRYLNDNDLDRQSLVAVIGHDVAEKMFRLEDPLGQTIRIDDRAFTVVGILEPVGLSGGAGAALIGRDLNKDVHIPFTTARALFGDLIIRRESGSMQGAEVPIAEIYFQSRSRDTVIQDAQLIRRLIDQRRPGLPDVSMIVPFELLENARKQALTGQIVSGAIAAISLLVGGIGIMNIMLATVTERTREIGIRRALGATRKHIISQFLVETGVLSAAGGLIGVALGLGLSVGLDYLVPRLPDAPLIGRFVPPDADLPVQISLWAVVIAFLVAAATGLVFGIYPARKAAQQDPIVALRHD